MTTIEVIEKHQLVVVIRTDTPDDAYEAALSCIRGGVKLIEIAFNVPDAHEVIRKLNATESITIGAGTVLTVADAKKALDAGAKYIVSPHVDEELIGFTKSSGAVSIPGACTPTEILRAHRAGADIIKLFPFVEMGGLKFLKTIRGPLPFIRYMPSGGVTLDTVGEYLSAKVSGIIVGSAIMKKEHLKDRNWGAIEASAAEFVRKVKELLAY